MEIRRRHCDEADLGLIERLYRSRGLEPQEYSLDLAHLLSYHQLMNIELAAERLSRAVMEDQRILVIGDFDADGATASALAVSALRAMGATDVHFLVPNRFVYGYGLSLGIVEHAFLSKPDLLITVDNGISNIEGVSRARALGMDVIITDHHIAADVLPDANCIINPNQPGDAFPSKAIAGVGVIFYVMCALRKALQDKAWFKDRSMPNMMHFLDLVALGTVADVVALDRNNRILLKYGLQRIKAGLARPGIHALLTVAGKSLASLKATDLGFSLAPRLNAAGRLDDMSLGISCLLHDDPVKALDLARQLDDLNTERRQIEAQMQTEALDGIQDLYGQLSHQPDLPAGLCLFQKNWHQGVIGIIAGRLKDKFHRPCIVFAEASATELKASARSVEGLHIRDVLARIDGQHPGLILKFGGHAMAAGLSIRPDDFSQFKHLFEQAVSKFNLNKTKFIDSDGALPATSIHLDTFELIQQAGPWGQAFPEPVFDNVFKIIDQRLLGQQHIKFSLQALNSSTIIDAIAFYIDNEKWPNYRTKYLHAVYQLDKNEYQGRIRLQLIINSMQPVTEDKLQERQMLEL